MRSIAETAPHPRPRCRSDERVTLRKRGEVKERENTPMITAIVQFTLPKPVTWKKRRAPSKRARRSTPTCRASMRKYYLRSEDGRRAGGVYLWETRAAAEAMYNGEWKARVEQLYGSTPEISLVRHAGDRRQPGGRRNHQGRLSRLAALRSGDDGGETSSTPKSNGFFPALNAGRIPREPAADIGRPPVVFSFIGVACVQTFLLIVGGRQIEAPVKCAMANQKTAWHVSDAEALIANNNKIPTGNAPEKSEARRDVRDRLRRAGPRGGYRATQPIRPRQFAVRRHPDRQRGHRDCSSARPSGARPASTTRRSDRTFSNCRAASAATRSAAASGRRRKPARSISRSPGPATSPIRPRAAHPRAVRAARRPVAVHRARPPRRAAGARLTRIGGALILIGAHSN